MVTLEGVQKTYPRVSHRGIHQLVNSRDGKWVFWANSIQTSEVHADSPLPILLLNHHSVGQLFGIKDLLNGFSLFQLVYLYPYCLGVIFGLLPKRLLTWRSLGIHIQLVTYKPRVNP